MRWNPSHPFQRNNFFFWFLFVMVLAVLFRVPYLIHYRYLLNFDEAVYGIMAQDILSGKGVPLFFYGQHYFGPLEALFTLPFFLLFSSSTWSLRAAVLVLTLLALTFFWRGLRLLLRHSPGWVFLAWTALSPLVLTVRSVHPSGHMGGLFCGGVLFCLAAKGARFLGNRWWFFGWGWAAGMGLWMHPGTLIFILASLAMILRMNFRSLSRSPIAMLGLLVGGLPFWIKTVSLKYQTFHFGQSSPGHLALLPFIRDVGRSLTHMNSFLGLDLLPLPLSLTGGIGLLGLLGMSLLFFNKKSSGREEQAVGLFAWSVLVLNILAYNYIQAHRFGYISYRYYLPMLVGLGMILELSLGRFRERSPFPAKALFLFLIFLNGITNLQGWRTQQYFRYQFNLNGPYLHWKDLPAYLEKTGIDRAYVDLFAEGPLNFIFKGEKIFSDFYDSRYLTRSWEVDAAPRPAFIIHDPGEAELFEQGLKAIGSLGYEQVHTPLYRIFYGIEPPKARFLPLDTKNIRIACHPHPEQGPNLLDDNLASLWSTEGGQKGDEVILLDLKKTVDLCRVDLIPPWLETFPKEVAIETSRDGRNWTKAVDLRTSNTLFWVGPHPAYKVWEGFFQYCFASRKTRWVRIRQSGTSPDPWELAEIVLYTSTSERADKGVDWGSLITFLKKQRIRRVVADLYCSARIAKSSADTIQATVRFNHAYSDPSLKDGLPMEAMEAVAVHHREAEGVSAFLNRQGWRFQGKDFGDYVLFHQLESPLSERRPIPNPDMIITSSHNGAETRFMTDQDPKTRWSSLTPRREGMYLRCDFKRPLRLSGVVLDPGPYVQDLPATLELLHAPDGVHFQTIPASIRFFRRIRWTGSHLFGNDASVVYLFPPLTTRSLKLICLEKSQAFYWSVGELTLLQGGN